MRIRYVALTLAAGLAASAAALSPGAARAADYPDRYSSYDEQDYDRAEEPDRYERRTRVEERYVEEEPVVEERYVRRAYVAPPVVVVGPRFYGPRFYAGPRWGRRAGFYGRGRWAHRGRW